MKNNRVIHEKFMRLALKLAQKAQGHSSPNPQVGALVVRGKQIIAAGYHRLAGSDHAEVVALNKAASRARGSSLYVTLEPCCHYGRTAPCVDKILASGVKEVIFAMQDPNPLNCGKGAQFLRSQGVKVTSGILEKEAQEINRPFIKYITQGLPFVTVKVAQSLDGKIATVSGDSHWISSPHSRNYTHRLRAGVDAILVGVNTVLQDNPLLSCRLNGRLCPKQPRKIVVDSRLRLRPNLRIFSRQSPAAVIIATTRLANPNQQRIFAQKAQLLLIKAKKGKVDLRDLLIKLGRQGITHILIEGGGEIIASALEQKIVDRMIVVIAPKIIGGRNSPSAVAGCGARTISQALSLLDAKFKRMGQDIIVEGRPV